MRGLLTIEEAMLDVNVAKLDADKFSRNPKLVTDGKFCECTIFIESGKK